VQVTAEEHEPELVALEAGHANVAASSGCTA